MDQYECLRTQFKNDDSDICKQNLHRQVKKVWERVKRIGTHSQMKMKSAGFQYAGESDKVQCDKCGLQVSQWTEDMNPLIIHAQRSPECQFIQSTLEYHQVGAIKGKGILEKNSTLKSEYHENQPIFKFMEIENIRRVRRRSFSNYPLASKYFVEQLLVAGFFSCYVSDRIICIYCNLICQEWKQDTDDPCEVHKTLSPYCCYVRSVLIRHGVSSPLIINTSSIVNDNSQRTPEHDGVMNATPCHPSYSEITERLKTFAIWNNSPSPPVEELVRAGFFYTGTENIVTCFYCNGSLQNWASTDEAKIEHARLYPSCAYAKEICGDELYQKIQLAQQVKQEYNQLDRSNSTNQQANTSRNNGNQLQAINQNLISRLVLARLDLPISQYLLDEDFKLSIIKRCWENQLTFNNDDFVSDDELLIHCIILQKQVDHIRGDKQNIIIPSVEMKLVREGKKSVKSLFRKKATMNNDNNSKPSNDSSISIQSVDRDKIVAPNKQPPMGKVTKSNSCITCYEGEKQIACVPCGHLSLCVSCSRELRTCPICGRMIEAFVRVYT